MIKFFKTQKRIAIKLIVLLAIISIFITFIILKSNSNIAEAWSTSFVRVYVLIIGNITSFFPYSLTELFFIQFIGLIIFFIVFAIIKLVKRKWFSSLSYALDVLLMVFGLLTTYQFTAEMMYNRKRAEVPLYTEHVTRDNFKQIVTYFINDLNDCISHLEFDEEGDVVIPYTIHELNDLVSKEYDKLNSSYLFSFNVRAKPMHLSSWLYREFHITGVTFIPLGEANVNTLNVNAGKGFTLAHEMAHTKGAMCEGDADLFAAYITLHSDDYYLRFCGYHYTFSSLLYLARYTGVESDYQELLNTIDANYFKNNQFNSKYWNTYNRGRSFANWVNDIYLKISGQEEGTGSYGDTPSIIDPETGEFRYFSNYQKLYFSIYYQ